MNRRVTFYDAAFSLFSIITSIVSLLYFFTSHNSEFLLATITFGSTSAPSDIAIYFDAVFSTSLANYRKTLTDNISSSNPLMTRLRQSGMYESYDGGTDIREPLMYALGQMESYDGYDELSADTTDGITEAVYVAKQLAIPISYSMKEVIQNRQKIISLVKAKITQAEMGFQEGFALHLLNGSGDGAGRTAKVNVANGSSSITPLAALVDFTPTTSTLIGNINQSTSPWWRNKTKTSAATTGDGLLQEVISLYHQCSLGPGGPPDLILCDVVTYELLTMAYFQRFRASSSDNDFPFQNIRFYKSIITMDDKVGDVFSDTVAATTYGTLYMLNTKFIKCRYISDRNFDMLTDENGKTFAKPLRGDSRLGHSAWMGEFTINNRRKQGVLGKIARTLTFTT